MKRYISPIGFSPHLVTRPVIAAGVSTGDRLEVLQPDQPDQATQERTENAINDVRSTLAGVVNNVDIQIRRIEEDQFDAITERCSSIITDGQAPVVCLGAGATDLHLPLTVATVAHDDHVAGAMMYSDINQSPNEVQLPSLTSDFPGRARETFRALAETSGNPVALTDLAGRTDVDRTTVGRHIDALEQAGFVETDQNKQQKVILLTLLGVLTARDMTTS